MLKHVINIFSNFSLLCAILLTLQISFFHKKEKSIEVLFLQNSFTSPRIDKNFYCSSLQDKFNKKQNSMKIRKNKIAIK